MIIIMNWSKIDDYKVKAKLTGNTIDNELIIIINKSLKNYTNICNICEIPEEVLPLCLCHRLLT